MLYGFNVSEKKDRNAAIAALVVYMIYRSRDKDKYKVSLDMWGQIERFVKSSAKRSKFIQDFMDSFKPKVCCESVSPFWASYGGENNKYINLVDVLNEADHEKVISVLYKNTSWVIALIRDRLEREKTER